MLLSVIIPVHNTAPYLRQCVESVLAQGFSDGEVEIIIVDDASTDDSPAVAQQLAREYPQARVILQEKNSGPGPSRNAGMDVARGTYLSFLDSDDFFESGTLPAILAGMERENLDMFGFDCQTVDEKEGKPLSRSLEHLEQNDLNDRQMVSGREYLRGARFSMMACFYIFRHDLIRDHGLRMVPLLHEDVEFTPRAIYWARRIRFEPIRIYCYRQRSTSISWTPNPAKDFDILSVMGLLRDFAREEVLPHDPESYRFFIRYIGYFSLAEMTRVIEANRSHTLEVLRYARRIGLGPLLYQDGFRRFLFGFSMPLFLWTRRARLRQKRRKGAANR